MRPNINIRNFVKDRNIPLTKSLESTLQIQEIYPSVNLDALHRMSSGDAECAGKSCGGNSCGGGDSGGSNFKKAINAASNNESAQ